VLSLGKLLHFEPTYQEGSSLLDPPSHAFLGEVLGTIIIPEDMRDECGYIL
jgi:hypothetical protein